jgi:hypothetical protein
LEMSPKLVLYFEQEVKVKRSIKPNVERVKKFVANLVY